VSFYFVGNATEFELAPGSTTSINFSSVTSQFGGSEPLFGTTSMTTITLDNSARALSPVNAIVILITSVTGVVTGVDTLPLTMNLIGSSPITITPAQPKNITLEGVGAEPTSTQLSHTLEIDPLDPAAVTLEVQISNNSGALNPRFRVILFLSPLLL
jgi:hypothetical protein